MNQYDPRLRDLYNGDPDLFEGYHQDYREGAYSALFQGGTLFVLAVLFLPIIYQVLFLLDYDLLPIPELLWNILVYITPSRLLDAVETFQNPLRIANPALRGIPRTHAAKSKTMRRVLGLDKPGGIMSTVAQAGRRRLSTLPGINMNTQGLDGRPAGLGNWDNSCYQNSVLQGLASLNSLPGYLTHPRLLKDGEEMDDEEQRPDMKMAEALRGLIETLNDPSNNGRRIWTPATLKNMSSWQQQDAQEYFSKILDEIDKEMGKVAKATYLSQGFESDTSSASRSSSSEALPISTFRNPLEGLIAQRVGCMKCGYSEGLSMIPFNCLTVPLGKAWGGYDVTECLDEYTKLEQIEGVECGKCTLLKRQHMLSTLVERTVADPESLVHRQSKGRLQAVTEALEEDDFEEKTLLKKCSIPVKSRVSVTKSRQAVIARPPKSLAVHINRSLFNEHTGELQKNHNEVRFPRQLDLGPWCLGSAVNPEETTTEAWLLNPDKPMIAGSYRPSGTRGPIYELRAVLTHYGRHENGHYICYKKHSSPDGKDKDQHEQWWRLSDDDVIKVSEENVLGQGGVFMLFYDCVEPVTPAPTNLKVLSKMADKPKSQTEVTAIESGLVTGQVYSSDILSFASSIPLPQIRDDDDLSEYENAQATQSMFSTEQANSSDILSLASNIPLPDADDDDEEFSEYEDAESIVTTREGESVATSVSEYDEEESSQNEEQEYQPTKAIVVPSYINQGVPVHNDGEEAGQQRVLSTGSLVMV